MTMPDTVTGTETPPLSLESFASQSRQAIPLLQSMAVQFTAFDDDGLRIDMPLAPNINDKQTGFGGSIAALATAAGWAAITLLLQSRNSQYDVMVVESHMRYLAPATEDFYALACVTRSAKSAFHRTLDLQPYGRITLPVMVEQNGQQIATYTGTYKVVAQPTSEPV